MNAVASRGENAKEVIIQYPDGSAVEGLLLVADAESMRVAVPGDDDIRTFTLANGVWRSEAGHAVAFRSTDDKERHFVCPKPLGMKAISHLLESFPSGDPLYVFSASGKNVHISVLRRPLSTAN